MHRTFKKNYNLVIKNFVPMCLHEKGIIRHTLQWCVSFTRNSCQNLPYRETARRKNRT